MSIDVTNRSGVSEAQAVAEISGEGFAAAAKGYTPGRSEPHRHDYDICLHILEGEFRLGLMEEGVVQSFGPGARLYVPAGTLHYEDYGPLRMVVGRRDPVESVASSQPKGA